MSHLLWVIALTLLPTLELRASIPYAMVVAGWSALPAASVAILVNTALAPLVWVFVDRALHLFLRIGWIDRIYQRYAHAKRDKLERLVERWGVLGLALFIGVPLPGTGVYSGAVAAYMLDFRFRDFLLASFLGCVLAGSVVTGVVASGSKTLSFLVKPVPEQAIAAPEPGAG